MIRTKVVRRMPRFCTQSGAGNRAPKCKQLYQTSRAIAGAGNLTVLCGAHLVAIGGQHEVVSDTIVAKMTRAPLHCSKDRPRCPGRYLHRNPTLASPFQEEYRYAPVARPVVRPLLLNNYKQEPLQVGV